MADANSVPEIEIQHAILALMKDRRVWTNGELKHKLATSLPWSNADRKRSDKRPNEYLWETRVNNALSGARHTSLHSKGLVESAGHGEHRITDHGYRYITEEYSVGDILRDLI
jgi:hypothetical protein